MAPPVLEPLTIEPLRVSILQEITRLKAVERDAAHSALLDALGSLYGGDLAGPFWIKGSGFNKPAGLAAVEMARADHYALDPSRFNIPQMSAVTAETAAEAEVQMSLAVMAYAREAYGIRFEPHSISLWLDHVPGVSEASDLLLRVAFAADPDKKLRALHPSHPTFEVLRMAYLVATGVRAPLSRGSFRHGVPMVRGCVWGMIIRRSPWCASDWMCRPMALRRRTSTAS